MNLKRAPTAGIKLFTMYKLVEAKVVGVLAAAGAIAQNAGRMYVCEDDVTLAKKLKLKPGRRHR